MKELAPLNKNVIVRMDPPETHVGLIELPQQALKADDMWGAVQAVGGKCKYTFYEQDRVCIKAKSGTLLRHEGSDFVIIHENDVLGVAE